MAPRPSAILTPSNLSDTKAQTTENITIPILDKNSLSTSDFTNYQTEATPESFNKFFNKEMLKHWAKYTSANFSRETKKQPLNAQTSHRFTKTTILKYHVHITTGPDRPFAAQINPLAQELTDLWEVLIKKDVGILPFNENLKKRILEKIRNRRKMATV